MNKRDLVDLRPICLFVTGLSASGKSTLSKNLLNKLIELTNLDVVLLDGEDIRKMLQEKGVHLGFSLEDRHRVSLEIARFASEKVSSGKIAIIAAIAPRASTRKLMKNIIGDVIEIHLSCSLDICASRDYKGHYQRAFRGEIKDMVGVQIEYECHDVDLEIDTGKCSPMDAVNLVLDLLQSKRITGDRRIQEVNFVNN